MTRPTFREQRARLAARRAAPGGPVPSVVPAPVPSVVPADAGHPGLVLDAPLARAVCNDVRAAMWELQVALAAHYYTEEERPSRVALVSRLTAYADLLASRLPPDPLAPVPLPYVPPPL